MYAILVSRFSFPTIFIVYAVIPYGVPELLRFIGYIDRTSLYCSSRDLLTSIMNETLFCTVQGTVYNLKLGNITAPARFVT